MGGTSNKLVQVAAAATEVALVDGAPSTRVKLLPVGEIRLRDGRGPFRLRDKAHAEQVIAATRDWLGSADFNFDYDHQVRAVGQGKGGAAVAAGWVKPANLIATEDGIYADPVEWTVVAAAKLSAREYRYVSPLFMVAPDSGDVIHLKNSSLVNVGAIDLPAIAAGLSEEADQMDLTAIAAALGLAATATVEEIAAAIGELKAAKPATSTIAIAAGLAETAGIEEIAAAVATIKAAGAPDPAKFVPIAVFEDTTRQLGILTADRATREVAAAMTGDDARITPAMKDWAIDYFKSNEAGFRKWLAAAPVVVAAGAQLGDRKPAEKATTLTADEIAACEMTGTSHEVFLAAKNAKIGEIA